MDTVTYLRSRMARKRMIRNAVMEGLTGLVVGAMLGLALIGWFS